VFTELSGKYYCSFNGGKLVALPSQPTVLSACPVGFTGADGKVCTGGWTADCQEECARNKCSSFGGTWVPLDYSKNPYTCNVEKISADVGKNERVSTDGTCGFRDFNGVKNGMMWKCPEGQCCDANGKCGSGSVSCGSNRGDTRFDGVGAPSALSFSRKPCVVGSVQYPDTWFKFNDSDKICYSTQQYPCVDKVEGAGYYKPKALKDTSNLSILGINVATPEWVPFESAVSAVRFAKNECNNVFDLTPSCYIDASKEGLTDDDYCDNDDKFGDWQLTQNKGSTVKGDLCKMSKGIATLYDQAALDKQLKAGEITAGTTWWTFGVGAAVGGGLIGDAKKKQEYNDKLSRDGQWRECRDIGKSHPYWRDAMT
jgi:hypothetical protein